MGKILEMTDVTKVYHEGSVDVTAVDSVTLDLRKGEVLLLMGPSGSGKTTLLSMMGCILHPTKGEIRVDGEVVSNLLEDELPKIRKRYFGFIFQAFNLFPSLTAQENIEICLRLKHWKREKIRPEARKLLDRVGLSDRTISTLAISAEGRSSGLPLQGPWWEIRRSFWPMSPLRTWIPSGEWNYWVF